MKLIECGKIIKLVLDYKRKENEIEHKENLFIKNITEQFFDDECLKNEYILKWIKQNIKI